MSRLMLFSYLAAAAFLAAGANACKPRNPLASGAPSMTMLEQTLVNMSSTQARVGSATRGALFQPIRFSGRWRTLTSGFPTLGQYCTRSKRPDIALDDKDVFLLE